MGARGIGHVRADRDRQTEGIGEAIAHVRVVAIVAAGAGRLLDNRHMRNPERSIADRIEDCFAG